MFGLQGVFGFQGAMIAFGDEARGLSETELNNLYAENIMAMRPAPPSLELALLAANHQPYRAQLDERFADFKKRLAEAMTKRGLKGV